MAIANEDADPEPPKVILICLHARPEELPELEKRIRSKELAILHKRKMDLTEEEKSNWFSEALSEEEEVEDNCYVVQGKDASAAWEELSQEIGKNICGTGNDDDLKRLFENVIVDEYLMRPQWTMKYLEELKPAILAGLTEMCKEMPEDPVTFLADFLAKNDSTDEKEEP